VIRNFNHVIALDFEFSVSDGERQAVVCLVARDLITGKKWHLFQEDLYSLKSPPFPYGNDSVVVAYYAPDEINCYLALDWKLPSNILDLFTEFRNLTNGQQPSSASLFGALFYFGLSGVNVVKKNRIRKLTLRGNDYSSPEKKDLLNYCENNVLAIEKLLSKMLPLFNLPLALLRGRYMKSAACIEFYGTPIDTESLVLLRRYWDDIQLNLINKIDTEFGVYQGGAFKPKLFENYLTKHNISWPQLPSTSLDLTDTTFKNMCCSHPQLIPLRELRVSLSRMRLSDLTIGHDGRNRCQISAFRSKTGRNQPSSSKFIFGPSVWLRALIKPTPGYGLAYVDWSQQEFGIAAALSGDKLMKDAYKSGDPYLSFAKQAKAVPDNATKNSHPTERDKYKACSLAVQYGMGAESLAIRISQPVLVAKELLNLHRETYKTFWKWSDSNLDYALLNGKLWTVFGWEIHVDDNPNPKSLTNFPMQANAAEMLRLACCFMTDKNINICAPIHDALLIEAPLEKLDQAIEITKQCMLEASQIVLNGFELNSDVDIIRYPARYMDKRGEKMWNTVWKSINELAETSYKEQSDE